MPTLTLRSQASKNGEIVAAPEGLAQRGPIVPVTLTVSDAHRQALEQAAKPSPRVVNGLALIDTGASHTCLDESTAKDVGLPVIDRATITSASHADNNVPVFSAKLAIIRFSDINLERVPGANLKPQGLIALIGRDVLSRAVLVYNGPDGSVSISI